jgi:CHAT domain-containing protein
MPTTLQHPSHESLAALAEGRLGGEEKMSVVEHLSRCRECYTLFAEAAAFVERGTQRSASPARRRTTQWVALAAAAAISIVIGSALLFTRQRAPLNAVSAAASNNHPVRFRVSGGVAPGETALRAGAAPANEELLRVYLDLKKQRESDRSQRNLDAFGVSALLLGRTDEAVDALRSAAAASPSANTESDLAAALAHRWESRTSAADLDEADAATRRALTIAPDHAEALFNRARLLEAQGNRLAAIAAWKRYLELDSTSAWARIARQRLQRLSAPTASEQWPPARERLIAGTADVRETVDRFPQQCRELVEEELLSSPSGDFALAERIGAELARRGDALPANTMREISTASEPKRKALAGAFRAYADGRRALKNRDHGGADRLLRTALATMESEGSPFAIRARIALASNHIYQGNYRAALDETRRISAADLVPYPAAEAQIRWLVGLSLLAQGRIVEGLASYRRSEEIYERLGEAENLATIRGLLAEALDYAGDVTAAEQQRQLAITGLMQLGNSERVPLIVSEAADAALRRGNLDRALALQRRVRAHADAAHDTVWSIHAALDCSEILCARREFAKARREIAGAEERLRSINDPATRRRLDADLQLASLRAAPDSAGLGAYDAIIALLRSEENHYQIAKLLLEKGERLRRRGQLRDAEKTLRAALEELESVRGRVDDVIARSRYFETGRRIVDTLVITLIDQGRSTDALLALQRASGRTVLESLSERSATAAISVSDLLDAIPSGAMAIEYKLIGNRLFTWVIREGRIAFAQNRADRAAVRRSVALLEDAVLHDRRADFDRAAGVLHTALLAPFEKELRDATLCILVPDAELSDVPFEALRANGSAPFLIERVAVAYAPSLAVLKFRRPAESLRIDTAALLGDPLIDRQRFTDLPSLSASADEVRDAAAIYPHNRTFLGADASRSALLRSLLSADVVHVAAHSIENADAPFLSMLLLSASGSDSGVVYAHDIAGSKVKSRVVVLAGCGTAVGARLGTEGTTSLATAFLAGGAEGVVATCWPIRDDTATAITTAFHRRLHGGASPASALRGAKIEALRAHPERLSWVPYQLLVASKAAIEGRS